MWSLLYCGAGSANGARVSGSPGGPGSSWVLVPLLRRKSRTAVIVDWAQQMRESDRPTDTPALHCTAPHPGTGHRVNLKGIDSLHSCYIRRGTSLSRSTDSLAPRPLEAAISHPFL